MLKNLIDFFRPPVFADDEDKTRIARNANTIALTLIGLILVYEVQFAFVSDGRYGVADFLSLGFAGLMVLYWLVLKSGRVRLASLSMVITFWVLTTALAYTGNGVQDIAFQVNFVILLIASLLLGWQGGVAIAILSILAGFGLVYLDNIGFFTPYLAPYYSPFAIARDYGVIMVMSSIFVYLLVSNLQNTLNHTRLINIELKNKNDEFSRLQDTLQIRSVELDQRSKDLETAIQQNALRTSEFEIISQVTRASTSVKDYQDLLPRTAELIHQRFGFYHVGIFLLDPSREYAILQAVNKEGRKQLLDQGHKVIVDPFGGAVGLVGATGIPRIVANPEEPDENRMNSDYPDSRSELTLPIKMGEITIGVIDMHSQDADAFNKSHVELFSILADQLAIAIQNTSLYREAQIALAESQAIYGAVAKQAWKKSTQSAPLLGYRFSGANTMKLTEPIRSAEARAAMKSGEVVINAGSRTRGDTTMAVPLKLRGETIGVINIQMPGELQVTNDEADIVRAAADRIAIALENSSLMEDSQRRANQERVISEISSKLGASVRTESILKTAAKELNQFLEGAEILIKLKTDE